MQLYNHMHTCTQTHTHTVNVKYIISRIKWLLVKSKQLRNEEDLLTQCDKTFAFLLLFDSISTEVGRRHERREGYDIKQRSPAGLCVCCNHLATMALLVWTI